MQIHITLSREEVNDILKDYLFKLIPTLREISTSVKEINIWGTSEGIQEKLPAENMDDEGSVVTLDDERQEESQEKPPVEHFSGLNADLSIEDEAEGLELSNVDEDLSIEDIGD